MTGTSIDAVDAALILTDGVDVLEFGPAVEVPYSADDRQVIEAAVAAARVWNWIGPAPEAQFEAARKIAVKRHGEAFELLMSAHTLAPAIVGIHGQTVLHRRPKNGRSGATLQIIDAEAMITRIGYPLAYDFRSADIADGGEGAPLSPIYHQALLRKSARQGAIVLNLGGVANLTAVSSEGTLIAFDAGPANGPIDEWVAGHGRGTHDVDGHLAAAGQVHEGLLSQILEHPFFDEAPPKSLDRYDFNANLVRGLSLEDGAATLTALCARAVAIGVEALNVPVGSVIVCGGGRHNPILLDAIGHAVTCRVETAEQAGWRGDSVEAEAFALLAVRTLRGLPISFPGTTGAPVAMTGGRVLRP